MKWHAKQQRKRQSVTNGMQTIRAENKVLHRTRTGTKAGSGEQKESQAAKTLGVRRKATHRSATITPMTQFKAQLLKSGSRKRLESLRLPVAKTQRFLAKVLPALLICCQLFCTQCREFFIIIHIHTTSGGSSFASAWSTSIAAAISAVAAIRRCRR